MTRLAPVLALILLTWPPMALAEPGAPTAAEASTSPEALDGTAEARALVESLHEVLLGCMKEADELGFQGRYERIASNLPETFDLRFMARTGVGATWKELDSGERAEFVELSRRLSAARYAANFDGYDGQRFETHSQEPAARGTVIVRTELIQPKDRNVGFDYRLRRLKEGWRIIDVVVDGQISELVIWRGQYRAVIEDEGYPQLVETMEQKIDEYSRE